jgi:hypothetical protein
VADSLPALKNRNLKLGLEIDVLGIGYPLYEELFPKHVADYKARFTKAK